MGIFLFLFHLYWYRFRFRAWSNFFFFYISLSVGESVPTFVLELFFGIIFCNPTHLLKMVALMTDRCAFPNSLTSFKS